MRVLIYDPDDEASVEKFVKAVQELPPGKKYRFEMHEIKPVRSLAQNKMYWAIIHQIAKESGHTREEIDHMFRMSRHNQLVFYPSGKSELIPAKTSDKDTAEFTAIIDNLQVWCQENFPEVRLENPKLMTYERWLEIEDSYHRSQKAW